MIALFSQNPWRFVLPFFLLAAACGSQLVLISKSSAVPAGVDLSGMWRVREESDALRLPNAGGWRERLIPRETTERSRQVRRRGGTSAQVFLEYGKSLKITQTAFSIFISYDRSVVEEYTFGENRVIEIGPIEARRVSGWEGGAFAVETLDDSGVTLFEAWHMSGDKSVLIRDIRISNGKSDSFVHQQFFDRG